MCIQSDNETCFYSQEIVPSLFHLIAEYYGNTIKRWIFTDAKIGQVRLDTHFLYVNVAMKSYVENNTDINMEGGIFKALYFQYGITGTSSVLLETGHFQGPIIYK